MKIEDLTQQQIQDLISVLSDGKNLRDWFDSEYE